MLLIPCVFGFHLILNIDSSSGNNKKKFTKLLKALFTIGIIQQKKAKANEPEKGTMLLSRMSSEHSMPQ